MCAVRFLLAPFEAAGLQTGLAVTRVVGDSSFCLFTRDLLILCVNRTIVMWN